MPYFIESVGISCCCRCLYKMICKIVKAASLWFLQLLYLSLLTLVAMEFSFVVLLIYGVIFIFVSFFDQKLSQCHYNYTMPHHCITQLEGTMYLFRSPARNALSKCLVRKNILLVYTFLLLWTFIFLSFYLLVSLIAMPSIRNWVCMCVSVS